MSGFDCTSVHDVNFDAEKVRFSHQLINRNFGPNYQRSLLNATLAVFGLDEISTRMLEAVSSAGVGHVLLIDSTTVQPWDSNVNVVDVGESRATTWRNYLLARRPEMSVTICSSVTRAEQASIVKKSDVVFCSLEDVAFCERLADLCEELDTPFVWSGLGPSGGAVSTFIGDITDSVARFAQLDPENRIYFRGMSGAINLECTLTGVVAASEIVRLLLGQRPLAFNRELCIATDRLSLLAVNLPDSAPHRTFTDPLSAPAYYGLLSEPAASASDTHTISVHDLQRMLKDKDKIQLVDVRDPYEYEYAHIEGAVLMPMSSFFDGDAWTDLDNTKTPVFICRVGIRSAEVLALAHARGLENAMHVGGGMVAWSATIDRSVSAY